MKKLVLLMCFILLSVSIASLPGYVSAQGGDTQGGGQQPIDYEGTGGAGGLVPCDGPRLPNSGGDYVECDYNQLITLIQNIITWMISIMGVVAALLFAYAGFLYLTSGGDSGKVNQAKKIFKSVLFGIVIVLAAWLIVNTLIGALGLKDSYNSLG